MAGHDAASIESRNASAHGGRRRRKFTTFAPAPASNVNSSASSPKPAGKKKRKRRSKKQQSLLDLVPMGGNFSRSSDLLNSSSVPTDPDPSASDARSSSSPDHVGIGDHAVSAMNSPDTKFGKNRLAGGFPHPHSPQNINSMIPNPRRPSKASFDSSGGTRQDAIEISDSDSEEEMDDSEGGMVVSLVSSDRFNASDEEMDDGSEDETAPQQHEAAPPRASTNGHNRGAATSSLRLSDLDPGDLEEQLRYGFYHLDRNQIDLNRLVICLSCMQEGHMASACSDVSCTANSKVATTTCSICSSREHMEHKCPQRFFPKSQFKPTGPARLWISCCVCASRSHLVGDCRGADQSAAARWSLKALDPAQIINLTLETSTRNLEREAENRGLRPPGLRIKGRASLSRFDGTGSAPPPEDEPFIRSPIGQRQDRFRHHITMNPHRSQRSQPSNDRYDRFDAPTYDRGHAAQGRDSWYGTDSFGDRRRSRSPGGDSYRPDSRRSPSPRRYNGYRQNIGPPPSDYWQRRPANNAFDRSYESQLPARPQPPPAKEDIRVQLPTRKGSNPNLPANPMRNNPPNTSSNDGSQGRKGKPLKSTAQGPAKNELLVDGVRVKLEPGNETADRILLNAPFPVHQPDMGQERIKTEAIDVAMAQVDDANGTKDDFEVGPALMMPSEVASLKIPAKVASRFDEQNAQRRRQGMAPLSFLFEQIGNMHGYLVDTGTGIKTPITSDRYREIVKECWLLENAMKPYFGYGRPQENKNQFLAYVEMHNQQRRRLGLWDLMCLHAKDKWNLYDPVVNDVMVIRTDRSVFLAKASQWATSDANVRYQLLVEAQEDATTVAKLVLLHQNKYQHFDVNSIELDGFRTDDDVQTDSFEDLSAWKATKLAPKAPVDRPDIEKRQIRNTDALAMKHITSGTVITTEGDEDDADLSDAALGSHESPYEQNAKRVLVNHIAHDATDADLVAFLNEHNVHPINIPSIFRAAPGARGKKGMNHAHLEFNSAPEAVQAEDKLKRKKLLGVNLHVKVQTEQKLRKRMKRKEKNQATKKAKRAAK